MTVLVSNLQTKVTPDEELTRLVTESLESVLQWTGYNDAEVSLVFVDDQYICELNNQYRGINRPTDVLSFAMLEEETPSDAKGAYTSTQLSGARRQTQPKATKTSQVPDAGFFDFGKAATSDTKGAYTSTQLSGARKLTQPKAKKTSPDEEMLLGDIVISLPTAERQAEEYGHGLRREVVYLAVHGALHLLGYDHIDETDRQVMREKEEEFLSKLNLSR